jgi:hypothetical protein
MLHALSSVVEGYGTVGAFSVASFLGRGVSAYAGRARVLGFPRKQPLWRGFVEKHGNCKVSVPLFQLQAVFIPHGGSTLTEEHRGEKGGVETCISRLAIHSYGEHRGEVREVRHVNVALV